MGALSAQRGRASASTSSPGAVRRDAAGRQWEAHADDPDSHIPLPTAWVARRSFAGYDPRMSGVAGYDVQSCSAPRPTSCVLRTVVAWLRSQLAAAPQQMAAAGVTLPPHSVKRKASSGLSEILKRLSKWQSGSSSVAEDEEEVEEPASPRSFSMGLRKIMRLIGLRNSEGDEPGAPAQPPPAVASAASRALSISVDSISELSLDELVDKAFPPDSTHAYTHALALMLTLALTRPSRSSLPCCSSGAASTSPGSLTSCS